MTDLSRTFGKWSPDETERERRAWQVFEDVAHRYELMNDLMGMGIHRLWKRAVARLGAPRAGMGYRNPSCANACTHVGHKPVGVARPMEART